MKFNLLDAILVAFPPSLGNRSAPGYLRNGFWYCDETLEVYACGVSLRLRN